MGVCSVHAIICMDAIFYYHNQVHKYLPWLSIHEPHVA